MHRGTETNDESTNPGRIADSGSPLLAELDDLREQLREARETLDAIQTGAVDALVLGLPGEERVFALTGADRPYRLLVEAMHEGAATISSSGTILYANARLGELAGRPVNAVIATPALELVAEPDRSALARLLTVEVGERAQAEFELAGRGEEPVGVQLSVVGFELDGTLLRSLLATDLSDRRRSEAELAAAHARLGESEARLRTALDQMLEGVSFASAVRNEEGRIADFRIDYVNPALARLGRVPAADQVGHTLLELFPAHGASGLFDEYVQVVETGVPSEVEDYHFVDPDAAGGPLDQWLDLRAAKHGDGYVRSVRDVTERRAAVMRLSDSEYFFRETQRAALVGSYRATFAEDRWESSEVLDAIYGIDAAYPRTVAGWLDLIHPDDRAGMERHLQVDVIEGRQPFAKEYRVVRPCDGETRWVSGLGAVTVDPDGRVAALAGTIQDITTRRIAETEMRRLSTAIEQSADSVMITDAAGAIEYVNPAFERASGYALDEVLGKNPRLLNSGVQRPAFYAAMWATLTAGRSFTGEIVNRRKDGTLFREEAVISPVGDDTGAVTSYVAVKRDVTRERAREAELAAIARERAMIAGSLADLLALPTAASTAEGICQQVASLTGAASASIATFAPHGPAESLAFVRADGVPVRTRSLPAGRSRTLLERAGGGPWVEAWVRRRSHPYARLHDELGTTALAYAPIRHGGEVVGLLTVTSSREDSVSKLTESLPALLEFAGIAGAIMGPAIVDLAALDRTRDFIYQLIRDTAFRPVFQPIVDLGTGERVGYEALTRFANGMAPDLVFADSRRAGLEVELELATLSAAIGGATQLPHGAWLSLNVSPTLVTGATPRLTAVLGHADRPLVLEVTEHVPVADYAKFRECVGGLRPKVRVAVDDAGSGIANFGHIVELRPAFVKVDITLIRGLETDHTRQALVLGLLQFAKESASQTIAEGVETEKELGMLRRLGVPLAQGYLLARPAPAEHWATSDPRHAAVRGPRTRAGASTA